MTFVGIVIFTVYSNVTLTTMDCDPAWSTRSLCADIAKTVTREEGRYEGRYLGEFDSLEECDKASGKVTYPAKDGERVDSLTEVICVPKDQPK